MDIPKPYLKNKFVRLFKAYMPKENEKIMLNVNGDDFAFTQEEAVKILIQERLPGIFKDIDKTDSNIIDITEVLFPNGIQPQITVVRVVIMNNDFDNTVQMNPDEYSIHYPIKTVAHGFEIRDYRVSLIEIDVDLKNQIVNNIKINWEEIDPKSI